MATTVYFPSSGSPPISPSVSSWDNTASTFVRRAMNVSGTKSNTAFSNHEWTIAMSSEDSVVYQGISSLPLATQTISGTVDFGGMFKSSVTGATFSSFRIWVATPAGAKRGSDLVFYNTNVNTIDSSSYTQQFRDDVALVSNTSVTEGDYLVIEIGVYATNSSSKTVGFKSGDPTANSNITTDSGSTTLAVANCVFSDDITFCTAPTSLDYSADQGNTVQAENSVAITGNSPTYSGGTNATETFSIVSGTIATGLSLNSSTGEITGTPTVDGTFQFTVRVSNVAGSADRIVTYQVYTGTPTDPPEEDPEPEDPYEFSTTTGRKRNTIYAGAEGSITVDNPKPILLGMMVTASDNACRVIIKESPSGLVVLDIRIEAAETRHLSFTDFGGIHLSQTFEIFELRDVGCCILYGTWGKPMG
jgi:hypothetical protein